MNALAVMVSLLGPLLMTEWLISIERRRVLQLPRGMGPAERNVVSAVLTVWLMFGWLIALIMLLTALVTTPHKKG